jgi:hypothetical protein
MFITWPVIRFRPDFCMVHLLAVVVLEALKIAERMSELDLIEYARLL